MGHAFKQLPLADPEDAHRGAAVRPQGGRDGSAGLFTPHNSPQINSLNSPKSRAYISSAIGGSTSFVAFHEDRKDETTKEKSVTTKGGGPRGKITGFSRASRLRLLRLTASINLTALKGSVFSVTLTYPSVWPRDPNEHKRHLQNWHKRLKRKYGKFAAIWRLGFQERGAPHYHLLLFMGDRYFSSRSKILELRSFVAESWYEACGKLRDEHLLAGTQVKKVRPGKQLMSHASRYLAKPEKLKPGSPSPGRFWGTWDTDLLPIEWETVRLKYQDGLFVRRVFRNHARTRGRGALHKQQVFLRYENARRLLSYLGYRRSWSTPPHARMVRPPVRMTDRSKAD